MRSSLRSRNLMQLSTKLDPFARKRIYRVCLVDLLDEALIRALDKLMEYNRHLVLTKAEIEAAQKSLGNDHF